MIFLCNKLKPQSFLISNKSHNSLLMPGIPYLFLDETLFIFIFGPINSYKNPIWSYNDFVNNREICTKISGIVDWLIRRWSGIPKKPFARRMLQPGKCWLCRTFPCISGKIFNVLYVATFGETFWHPSFVCVGFHSPFFTKQPDSICRSLILFLLSLLHMTA